MVVHCAWATSGIPANSGEFIRNCKPAPEGSRRLCAGVRSLHGAAPAHRLHFHAASGESEASSPFLSEV